MGLKQYWSLIRKRLWLILIIMVIGVTAAGIYSSTFITPQYEASTKLVVNQLDNPNGQAIGNLELSTINSNIQLIKTYKEIIKTPRIMGGVVNQHPELGLSVGELIRRVSVSAVTETQVMSLTVRDGNYKKAAEIVNAVSEVFKQEIPSVMRVNNISILNQADTSLNPGPVSPNTKLNVVIAFVILLMASVGLVLLLDYLDDSVKTESDIQQLFGVPTLTVIPRIKEEDLKQGVTSKDRTVKEGHNVTLNT